MTFPFRILTPGGTIVGGDVTHVQVRTQVGSLGVMARHAPMVAACWSIGLTKWRTCCGRCKHK